MAPHSSTVAWKIPWMEEPGRLQSLGSHRVGHDWSDLAVAAVWNKNNIFKKSKQFEHTSNKLYLTWPLKSIFGNDLNTFSRWSNFFLNDLQSCTTGDICVAVLWTWFIWPLFAKREFLNVLNSLRRFLRRILETQTGWRGSPTCVFSDERCFKIFLSSDWASLVAQTVKCLPAMLEPWVWSLSREDPLEKEMATHSSTLACKIPWMEEPGGLWGGKESDMTERLHFHFLLATAPWQTNERCLKSTEPLHIAL